MSKKQHRHETLGPPLCHPLVSAHSGSLQSHFSRRRGPWLSSEERALQGGCYSRPFYFPRPIKRPKRGGRMSDGGSVPMVAAFWLGLQTKPCRMPSDGLPFQQTGAVEA